MVETTGRADAWVERANDLYWSSTKRVDEIVDDLEISRSSLYASLEPVAAGLVCVDCHERMVFTNRTARERGVAVCPRCGRESGVTVAAGEGSPSGDRIDGREGAERYGLGRWRGDLAAVSPERVAIVGGAAALGMMLGAAAARAVRDRR